MTREEMLKKLWAGEDPLDLSIGKWRDVVKHLNKITRFEEFNKEIEMGEDNCALCEMYYYDGGCIECPVRKATGNGECRGTPFKDFVKACIEEDLEGMRKAATAELKFLENLKGGKDR